MAEIGIPRPDRLRVRPAFAAGILLLLPVLALATQPPQFHDLTDTGTIVGPFHKLLTRPINLGPGEVGEDIPTATVAAYCGDSDGCRVRLVLTLTDPDPDEGPKVRTRTLLVTPDGDQWIVYDSDDLVESNGSLSDGPSAFLLFIVIGNDSNCSFRERLTSLGFVRYHLEVSLGSSDFSTGDSATCRLIISD